MQIIEQLRDPLNETTRKARRNLLASSVVGLLIVKAGLVPEKIAAFGIEFTETSQDALLYILAAVVAYFLLIFVIYLSTEYASWQLALQTERIEQFQEQADIGRHEIDRHKNFQIYVNEIKRMLQFGRLFLIVRVFAEVIIPIGLGVWSIIELV